ncbi:MAG TPA: DUF5615 family PIN-like protein [Bacteroidia bacterium]|nr:DUF5615 family PIN-like protein [Bacteroidia bacterium]
MARLLLDTCVWGGTVARLAELGHDVVWTGLWPQDPGDKAILEYAFNEDRILVTLDKDFGELAIVKGMRHAGLIRLTGFRAAQMADAIHRLVTAYGPELEAGAIVTASPERVRIRSQR